MARLRLDGQGPVCRHPSQTETPAGAAFEDAVGEKTLGQCADAFVRFAGGQPTGWVASLENP